MYPCAEEGNKITFLIDSGASDHIINREDLFCTYTKLITTFKNFVAKHGAFLLGTKQGTLQVISNTGIHGTLENVVFCRDVLYNLLSVTRMQQASMTITFDQQGTNISKDSKIIMKGMAINNLVTIDFLVNINRSVSEISKTNDNLYDLWHQRLGHISKQFIDL